MEEELEFIKKSLESIKKEREQVIKRVEEDLSKLNKDKEPKIYSEGEEELKRRNEELDKINKSIEDFEKEEEILKKYDFKKLKEEKEYKQNALNKAQETLKNVDKNRDPKLYAEIEDEIAKRNKELDGVKEKEQKIEESKNRIEKIKNTYKIKKEEKDKKEDKEKDKKDDKENNKKDDKNEGNKELARLEEELKKAYARRKAYKDAGPDYEDQEARETSNIQDLLRRKNELEEKINPKKENKKKIYKAKFELSPEELNEYTELLRESNGEDSEKLNEFYKKLAEKRSNEIKNKRKDTTEKNPDGTLKYPPVAKKDTTERNPDGTLKYPPVPKKDTTERNPDGTLKYPPVLKKEKTATVEEKMKIVYRGDKNKYYIEDNGVKKVFDAEILKNKKAKMQYLKDDFTKDELKYIFGDDYENTMKKMVKAKIDPQLLSILSEKSLDYAKSYVDEFAKGETEEEKDLPYSMTYNLKDMRKEKENTKLSFFDRIKMSIMAKKNEKAKVAEYIPDTKSRKWLIFPIVGALAAGGIYALDKGSEKDKNPTRTTSTPVIDTVEPTTKTPDENQPTINPDENNIIENEDNNKEDVALKLGSRVYMKEGISYAETSTQTGRNAKIGDFSWRPQGEYTVDRMALYLNGSLIANIGTEGTNIDEAVKQYAAQYNVDPSQIVQKAHICVLEGHGGPTGWINMDEMSIDEIKENITKTYDEIQAEKQQQAQSQNQNNVQQQTGNER